MNPWEEYGLTEVEYLQVQVQALLMSREYWYEQTVALREQLAEERVA